VSSTLTLPAESVATPAAVNPPAAIVANVAPDAPTTADSRSLISADASSSNSTASDHEVAQSPSSFSISSPAATLVNATQRFAAALSALPADFVAAGLSATPTRSAPIAEAAEATKPAAQSTVSPSDAPTILTAPQVADTIQPPLHPHSAPAQKNVMERTFSISMPHTVAEPASKSPNTSSNQPPTRNRTQPPSQTDAPSALSERDRLANFAPATSTHSSSVQPAAPSLSAATPAAWVADCAALSPAQSPTQSAPPLAAQLATPSAVFTQPAAAPAPSHLPSQLPSDALPDPPHSGQLRVTPNNSELRISVQLPELGKVEVRAVTAHDVTTAHLTAFRHEALPILAAERTVLEDALKSRDVVLASFTSNSQGHSAADHRQQSSPTFTPSSSVGTSPPIPAISPTAEATLGSLPDYASISVHA
jgi:hypothetical protein